VIVSSLALDSYNFRKKKIVWRIVEKHVDRLMHKLKPSHIILFLDLFNKEPKRANKDFINKLLTIIPIHVEHLKDEELIKLMEVCINQNMVNERLFLYFIYPRIENRANRMNFKNYIKTLKLVSELHYQDDLDFWSESILPCVFNYEYSQKHAIELWQTLLQIKINCSSVDLSKYLILLENILKQFDNLKESGEDITEVLLKLEKDFSLIPTKKESLTLKQAKEAEKRLKDQATLKSFMEKINAQEGTPQDRKKDAELNIGKLLEIKDWKKARYELNLAEIDKIRDQKIKMKEEKASLKKKKTIKLDEASPFDLNKKNEVKEEKVIDIAPDNNSNSVDPVKN
jgi:hypothetical protein